MIFINFFIIPWYFQVFQVYSHFSRSSWNPGGWSSTQLQFRGNVFSLNTSRKCPLLNEVAIDVSHIKISTNSYEQHVVVRVICLVFTRLAQIIILAGHAFVSFPIDVRITSITQTLCSNFVIFVAFTRTRAPITLQGKKSLHLFNQWHKLHIFFTALQRSGEGYVCVCPSVILSTGEGGILCNHSHDAMNCTVQPMDPLPKDTPASDIWWPSLQTCSNLFNSAPPWQWHLVSFEAVTVTISRWYASYWNAFFCTTFVSEASVAALLAAHTHIGLNEGPTSWMSTLLILNAYPSLI